MNRELGYYWVKYQGNWFIGSWLGFAWWMHGTDGIFNDTYFEEIDERRIERELEKEKAERWGYNHNCYKEFDFSY